MSAKKPRPICARNGCSKRVKDMTRQFCSVRCDGLRRRKLRRFCKCGCKQRVIENVHRWLPGHMPASVRSDAGRKGRQNFAYRRRALCFRADLEQLGRTPTREDLLAVFHRVYKRGYNSGYQVGERAGRVGDTQALPLARIREAA
jgi:hypothetical protein